MLKGSVVPLAVAFAASGESESYRWGRTRCANFRATRFAFAEL
jgi:hypothetical protein